MADLRRSYVVRGQIPSDNPLDEHRVTTTFRKVRSPLNALADNLREASQRNSLTVIMAYIAVTGTNLVVC